MNFQFYLEKLSGSDEFKNFKKTHPDAYFCSAFFVIDKEGKGNEVHFDYFLPKEKKIISFQLEKDIQQIPVEIFDKRIPEKISINQDFEFDDIERLINDEMEKQGVKSKIQKIILSLQNLKGKDFLVGTIFVSMLGILKINISLSDKKVESFEKKSFFDMVKVLKKKK